MSQRVEIYVIGSLAGLTFTALFGSIVLLWSGRPASELLQIAMGGLGALASILAGSRFNKSSYAENTETRRTE